MKKIYTITGLVLLAFIMASLKNREAAELPLMPKSSGPPSCYAGEPPGSLTCATSGCHEDAPLNTGGAEVIMDLGDAKDGYTPGRTYTIKISVKLAGMKRAGFQCIALMDNDITTTPGEIILTDKNRTQRLDKSNSHSGDCNEDNKVWVEHTFNGVSARTTGYNEWSFDWKAPSASVGNVSFYLSALSADNNMAASGDQVYTLKQTIASTSGIGEGMAMATSFRLYPNPANTEVWIQTGNIIPEEVCLYSVSGACLHIWPGRSLSSRGEGLLSLSLSDQPAGLYFIQLKGGGHTGWQSLVVAR